MRKTMPFGKYKGQKISQIPSDYLEWAMGVAYDDLLAAIKQELNLRNGISGGTVEFLIGKNQIKMFQELIRVGYRELTKKYHPDKGGKTEDMQTLNAINSTLEDSF